jgi:hypothetical protein
MRRSLRGILRASVVATIFVVRSQAYALDASVATDATDAGRPDANLGANTLTPRAEASIVDAGAAGSRGPVDARAADAAAADAGAAALLPTLPALTQADAGPLPPASRDDAGSLSSAPSAAGSKPSGGEASVKPASNASDDGDDSTEHDPPLWTGTTRFASRFYEVGVSFGIGGLLYAPGAASVGMSGLTIQEHHGLLSKVGVALLVALGQSNRRYVGSTTSVEGNYVVRRDYYRSLTPAEHAAQAAALSAAIDGEYTTTLTVYGRDFLGLGLGTTQASGAEFSLGVDFNTFDIGGLPSVLTVGFYAASLSAPASWKAPGSKVSELSYSNLGVVGRWHFPASRYADVFLEWDANVLQLFLGGDEERAKGNLYTSPLKLGAYGNLTDRAYVRGQVNIGGLGVSDGKVGAQLELGVRF